MEKNNRILIVDALRGFALLLIVIIHFVEHFDFFFDPEVSFLFSLETDKKVMDVTFFIISGKAYSIFAILFGFSFFIQLSRQEEKGVDFRMRFLWRLMVLLMMGFVHSLVYKGDILHIYALLGLVLLLFYKVKTNLLYMVAILFALQIPHLYFLVESYLNPDFTYNQSFGSNYWREGNLTYATGSFSDVVSFNLWKGRATVWGWMYYNGRYLQLISLFIVGLILGRKKVFENIHKHRRALVKILIASSVVVVGYLFLEPIIMSRGFSDIQKSLLGTVISSYYNMAFTAVLITGIILLYLKFKKYLVFELFAAYGKMSLSNYVSQAVLGVIFFYGFGLGMYRYLGITWSLLLGVLVFFTQAVISMYWNKRYHYGPLEWLWRSSTYFNFNTKWKKKQVEENVINA